MTYRLARACRTPAALTLSVAAAAVLLPTTAGAQQVPMASPESVGMSTDRLGRLDEGIQRFIDEGRIAGAVLLVARDGKVVHLSALGDRYREIGDAMDVDDIFFIQSMTKAVVSGALMILFEEGYFLLDDPISKYLPEFADKTVVTRGPQGVEREPAARPITFRHVLTHTAGVDPNRNLLTEAERGRFDRQETLEATLVPRGPLPLAFHPGERWSYGSSTDYVAPEVPTAPLAISSAPTAPVAISSAPTAPVAIFAAVTASFASSVVPTDPAPIGRVTPASSFACVTAPSAISRVPTVPSTMMSVATASAASSPGPMAPGAISSPAIVPSTIFADAPLADTAVPVKS